MIFTTLNQKETEALGEKFATVSKPRQICLFGEMGTGKTAFVKGFMKGMGYTGEVTSPTFALCHRYETTPMVLHYDLYRLNGYDDLFSIGFFEDENCISIIEWSENAEDYLQNNAIKIYFSYGKLPDERIIETNENISF